MSEFWSIYFGVKSKAEDIAFCIALALGRISDWYSGRCCSSVQVNRKMYIEGNEETVSFEVPKSWTHKATVTS